MEVNSFLTGQRGVSLPFTDYCEPIVGETNEFVVLFNSIIEYGKKKGWKYIELRGGERFLNNLGPHMSSSVPASITRNSKRFSTEHSTLTTEHSFDSQPATRNLEVPHSSPLAVQPSVVPDSRSLTPDAWRLVPFRSYLGHTLNLSDNEEVIFSRFRDSTKRNIRKAITEGVVVEISNSPAAVKEFYRLNCITRKQHGLPPQPYYFFKNIHKHVFSTNHGFIVLASYANRKIAGAVYFHFGKKAIYKYGASDRNYQSLRANNLVMWEAIKRYCKNGYEAFCFGRTEQENNGLRQFKAGWGAEEKIINYSRYDLMKDTFITNNFRVSKIQKDILKRLPLPILNILGSLMYRHIG